MRISGLSSISLLRLPLWIQQRSSPAGQRLKTALPCRSSWQTTLQWEHWSNSAGGSSEMRSDLGFTRNWKTFCCLCALRTLSFWETFCIDDLSSLWLFWEHVQNSCINHSSLWACPYDCQTNSMLRDINASLFRWLTHGIIYQKT